jgi:hypothetical protein
MCAPVHWITDIIRAGIVIITENTLWNIFTFTSIAITRVHSTGSLITAVFCLKMTFASHTSVHRALQVVIANLVRMFAKAGAGIT